MDGPEISVNKLRIENEQFGGKEAAEIIGGT